MGDKSQQEGCCGLDGTPGLQQYTEHSTSMPAKHAGTAGIVHLFGGVFVGAVAEEMCRNWKVILQSSSSGIDLSAVAVAPTAPASVDGGSARSDESPPPSLPAVSHLPRGGSPPPEEEQRAADGGEARPAGTGELRAIKRARGGPEGLAAEGGGDDTSFVSECSLPTEKGMFRLRAYRYNGRHKSHEPVVMVCGDVFGSKRCDCKEQLDQSLRYVQENGGGAVIYLAQEGRGIGLANKVAAYNLQDDGLDTVEANRQLGFKDDERTYECVDFILRDMGIKSIRLMTNNPFKIDWLRARGIKVEARIPIEVAPTEHNRAYLETKAARMSHLINNL